MTWLRKNDVGYDDPMVLAIGNAAYGALVRMEQFASAQGTDGWVPAQKAREIASPAELRALERSYADLGKMLHRHGDECPCLKPHEWSAERGGFWIHKFLDLNPSRAEVDVARAKKAELRNPKLKHAVRVRDADQCRYCGKHCSHTDRVSDDGLTFDHVDPELADGMNNLVVACRGCNNRKNRRTPAQAGMDLLPPPTTVAGLVTSPDTGLSQDLSQVDGPAQVPTSPGRDGAGTGLSRPSPYLREQVPKAGIPHEEIPGQIAGFDQMGDPNVLPDHPLPDGTDGPEHRRSA